MTNDEFKVAIGKLVGEYHKSNQSMVNEITVKRDYAGGDYYYIITVKESLAVKTDEQSWTSTD